MSIEAMTWAMNLDKSILKDPAARHVLLILGNHARNDGRAAFPSVATIMKNTCFSRRTVQLKLKELRLRGVIKYGNQGIAKALGLSADRTPTVYDICMFDEIKPQDDVERGVDSAPRADYDTTGRRLRHDGAQITTQRGAYSAPKPSRTLTPSLSQSASEKPDADEHPIFNNADQSIKKPCDRFSMHREWCPAPENLSAELLRRGMPIDTRYEPGWLADFTAHYADQPGRQQSESAWTTQFAKWIQQNINRQNQATQNSAAGGNRHENSQSTRNRRRTAAEARAAAAAGEYKPRRRRTAAEARAAAEAERAGVSGRIIEGSTHGC